MKQSDIDSLDVQNITRFDRTKHETEAFALLAVLVAGKNAKVQQEKLKEFLQVTLSLGDLMGPFDYVRYLDASKGWLLERMKQHGLGQYRRLERCFRELVELDARVGLHNCHAADLEEVHGIGPKTARFFLLHSRPNQRLAVLDTHILAWLKTVKKCKNVPKVTPSSGARYRLWETRFLYFCDRLGKTPAQLDLEIWNQRSKNGNAYNTVQTKKKRVQRRNRLTRITAD